MTGWIFAVALVVAMTAMGTRSLRRKTRLAAVRRAVGRSPERPLPIRSFHELDAAVDAARCACGGELDRIGEGSRTTPTGSLRVVRCECLACEEGIDLFFDLAELRH